MDVQVGDTVWSRLDEASPGICTVVETKFESMSTALVYVRVGETSIGVTPEHPLWVRGVGWQAAGALADGDVLSTLGGKILSAYRSTSESVRVPVYNLEVRGTHTYFVGLDNVWTHNQSSPNTAFRQAAQQGGYLHPMTGQWVATTERLAADHVVPQVAIKAMPGFDKLTVEQQSAVLNNLANSNGLPRTFNSAKWGHDPGTWTWKGNALHPGYAEWERMAGEHIKGILKSQIESFLSGACG
jgi:hypothetical protein